MKKSITFLQILMGYGGFVGVIVLFQLVDLSFAEELPLAAVLTLRILFNLLLAVPPLIIMLISKDNVLDYGFSHESLRRQILIGVGIAVGMGLVLTLIPCLFGLKNIVYQGTVYRNPWYAAYELLYFLVAVGLVEEFVFRGFLYSKLSCLTHSDVLPILISSVLFGLAHIFTGNVIQVFTTALVGAFFCWCKENIPGCTVLSLAIAHGLHDWLIRAITSLF